MIELTIKTAQGHYPTPNCHGGCSLYMNMTLGCGLRLAERRVGPLNGCIKDIAYWEPEPDCPGSGHFCLTPCEESDDA